MNKEEFLQFRESRREIIEMCYSIYAYDVNAVEKKWEKFSSGIKEIIGRQADALLNEAYDNMCKKNWIRVRDMLLSLDSFLRKKLKENCSVFPLWHDDIWKENWTLLKYKNAYLADKIFSVKDSSRIEVSAGGTECCVIRIHEKDITFQLFSSENPWLESEDRAAHYVSEQHAKVYLCGFNGGFLTGTIQRRFPDIELNVYISNLDIFSVVLHNICLADILGNEKLHLFYDPTGLDFRMIASASWLEENSAVIIDNVERRAFVRGGMEIGKDCMVTSPDICAARNTVTVGEKIYLAIDQISSNDNF